MQHAYHVAVPSAYVLRACVAEEIARVDVDVPASVLAVTESERLLRYDHAKLKELLELLRQHELHLVARVARLAQLVHHVAHALLSTVDGICKRLVAVLQHHAHDILHDPVDKVHRSWIVPLVEKCLALADPLAVVLYLVAPVFAVDEPVAPFAFVTHPLHVVEVVHGAVQDAHRRSASAPLALILLFRNAVYLHIHVHSQCISI